MQTTFNKPNIYIYLSLFYKILVGYKMSKKKNQQITLSLLRAYRKVGNFLINFACDYHILNTQWSDIHSEVVFLCFRRYLRICVEKTPCENAWF